MSTCPDCFLAPTLPTAEHSIPSRISGYAEFCSVKIYKSWLLIPQDLKCIFNVLDTYSFISTWDCQKAKSEMRDILIKLIF